MSTRSREAAVVVGHAGALAAAVAFGVPPAPASEPAARPRTVVAFSGPAPQGRYTVRVVMDPGDAGANERAARSRP